MSAHDLRDSLLFREAREYFGHIKDAGNLAIRDVAGGHLSSDGRRALVTAWIDDAEEGPRVSRIVEVDLANGKRRLLTSGPGNDRLPKVSPDGRTLAFLSDPSGRGDFQLHLLDEAKGTRTAHAIKGGWAEYLHWSPGGDRILLGVAEHGADVAGGQGGKASVARDTSDPEWMPTVVGNDDASGRRSSWIYDLGRDALRPIETPNINIWEAVWCGPTAITATVSAGADEGDWYTASLALIDIDTGECRSLLEPEDQLGWPSASPSGSYVAVVEAVCSDRGFVAGELHLLAIETRARRRIDTNGVDVTCCEWRSEHELLLAGHRGFETVIGLVDTNCGTFVEIWSSSERTTPGRLASVTNLAGSKDIIFILESFLESPAITILRQDGAHSVASLVDHTFPQSAPCVTPIEWLAPDGLTIQGWLIKPLSNGPHPLIMNLHGGPVWLWRPNWLGRSDAWMLMLVARGYAFLLPNPRGSSGRGQAFARLIQGDLGGADAKDCLAGIDAVVDRGIADPARLGVSGISYGGFMSAWLVTQTDRFRAATLVAPFTNQVTQHLISNIPHFGRLFLGDSYTNLGGRYFTRSPVLHAHRVTTPTLIICGALDRCTPSEEATQFFHALCEHGVPSVLVTYPKEGHGVRSLPAAIDCAARLVGWFETHLSRSGETGPSKAEGASS